MLGTPNPKFNRNNTKRATRSQIKLRRVPAASVFHFARPDSLRVPCRREAKSEKPRLTYRISERVHKNIPCFASMSTSFFGIRRWQESLVRCTVLLLISHFHYDGERKTFKNEIACEFDVKNAFGSPGSDPVLLQSSGKGETQIVSDNSLNI